MHFSLAKVCKEKISVAKKQNEIMPTKGGNGNKSLFDTGLSISEKRKSETKITPTNPRRILNQRPLSNASY